MSPPITSAGSRTLLPARQEWLFGIRPDRRLLTGRAYRVAKRIMDLVLVVLALPVLLPLLGLCIGRASTEFDDRLRLDIAYIEQRGLWLDLQILARTVVGGSGKTRRALDERVCSRSGGGDW